MDEKTNPRDIKQEIARLSEDNIGLELGGSDNEYEEGLVDLTNSLTDGMKRGRQGLSNDLINGVRLGNIQA